ncbi:MAG: NADPH-dependent glutamate synthase [Bacteroidales bacterium]|jgi:glutamate synthase (NADPH/NADH) small chain|nr:NADPH-dependent glutamate synthase [Bacteroidales bacterium]
MYQIQKKEFLTPATVLMEVEAPWIAQCGRPGQFLIVIPDAHGERVPLTICDIDHELGIVTIVFQIVGESTQKLADMAQGDSLFTIVGPLGRPAEVISLFEKNPNLRILFVAGGVGTAPVYPQAKWAYRFGLYSDIIVGARSKDFIFFEDRMRSVCQNLHIMTDDGSYGEKGLVTDKIKQLIESGIHYDCCVAIGPLPMMKFVSLLTKQYNLPTIVSLNSMMVDGTGMCGACRVTVGDKVQFTCVDGPEFDGHLVNFDEAMSRLARPDARKYRIATSEGGHRCNLADAVDEAINAAEKPQRQQPAEQEPDRRILNFDEVSYGFNDRQAVVEASRCLNCKRPLCVTQCPVGINIPAFIAAVKEGRNDEAGRIIAMDSTLPAVCGRVCPQETQCEGACILGHKSQPIAIGALERYVADWNREHAPSQQVEERQPAPDAIKVAIIGSGPSGLACAGDLAKAGFDVTIFEALHHAGGVLVYGIPEFRLPKQRVVAPEIENLKRLGVKIFTNVIVGKSVTVDDLFEHQGFQAVYIASGAGLPKFMGIPGETLVGVLSANELLTRTNLMHGYDSQYDTPILLGRKVAVVGGGNVAMDAARTARRLGCEVTVIYRRGEEDMPARKEEVHHAKQEGIQFCFQCNPEAIIDDGKGNVAGVRLVRMAMGEPDASGRRRFSAIPDSQFELELDNMIIALGTSPNPLIKSTTPGLDTESWGGIKTDDEGRTSRRMVFAGGDAVSGAATVILAMGAGRQAAKAIINSFKK